MKNHILVLIFWVMLVIVPFLPTISFSISPIILWTMMAVNIFNLIAFISITLYFVHNHDYWWMSGDGVQAVRKIVAVLLVLIITIIPLRLCYFFQNFNVYLFTTIFYCLILQIAIKNKNGTIAWFSSFTNLVVIWPIKRLFGKYHYGCDFQHWKGAVKFKVINAMSPFA